MAVINFAVFIGILFVTSPVWISPADATSTGCAHRGEICGGFAGVRCCDGSKDTCIYDLGSAGHCRSNKQ